MDRGRIILTHARTHERTHARTHSISLSFLLSAEKNIREMKGVSCRFNNGRDASFCVL